MIFQATPLDEINPSLFPLSITMSRVFPEEDITTSPTASSSNLNTSEGMGRFSEPDDVASADQDSSTFGYPLQRMVPVESWDISTEDLSSEYDHDAYYQMSRPQSDSSSTSTFHHVSVMLIRLISR